MSDRSLARLVANALEPRNWIVVLVVLLGWHAGGPAGVGWGLVIGLFAAIAPALFVRYGVRHWQWTGRRVSRRRERMAALAFTVASQAAGAATLLALRAPRAMTGYVLGMLATSIAVTAISSGWKISVHCTVASATVALLALTYGPAVLPGYALVALVAWSRVALGDHTTAQAAAGVALGVIAAALTHLAADRFLLLSTVVVEPFLMRKGSTTTVPGSAAPWHRLDCRGLGLFDDDEVLRDESRRDWGLP